MKLPCVGCGEEVERFAIPSRGETRCFNCKKIQKKNKITQKTWKTLIDKEKSVILGI